MRKISYLLLCIVLLTGLISGCGNQSGSETQSTISASEAASSLETTAEKKEPVTIQWLVFETPNLTADYWKHIIDTFEQDNPDVKIEKVLATGDSRTQFAKTLLAAGQLPDVGVEYGNASELVNLKALMELPADLVSLYEDAGVAKYDGKVYTLPVSKQLRVQAFYNKKLFADAGISDAPKTWKDFTDTCEKLKSKGIAPIVGAGAKDIWATGFGYWISVLNNDLLDMDPNFNVDLRNGTQKWNNPVTVASLKRWQELIKKGYYHKGSMSFGYTQHVDEFFKGNAAIILNGSWMAGQIDGLTEKLPFETGIFPVPQESGAKSYCATYGSTGISATTKNPEACIKFLKYVYGGNKELYAYILKADGLLSATKDPVYYPMGAMMTVFVDNLKDLKVVPEITKVIGDGSMPAGQEDFMLKSMQNIFMGKDVEAEVSTWDVQFQKGLEAEKASK